MQTLIFITELFGIAAFAISGAIPAIRKEMDLFGVIIMGVTASCGGGLIRDLILGLRPPMMFRDPVNVLLAACISLLVFIFVYIQRKYVVPVSARVSAVYDKVLIVCDAVGLAAFSAHGVYFGCLYTDGPRLFLLTFLGSVTGVGGGLLRDILAGEKPYIFTKHVYAVAVICGAFVSALGYVKTGLPGMAWYGFPVTLVIRLLAVRYKWNLPVLRNQSNQ